MAEAIRRLLGLVPVLLVGSILLFFLLGKHPKVDERRELPLFFQRYPMSSGEAASSAMRSAARGEPAGSRALAELGGAALPHVLPRLGELDVTGRRLVADALEPIAARMQIESYRTGTSLDGASGADRSAADRRLLAWERYYEDHDLDFRPLSVERLVRRLSDRSSTLRQADLHTVDSYALPYLVRALGRVDSARDVARVQRLAAVIVRFDSDVEPLPDDADATTARAWASHVRKDFDRNGAQFTELGRWEYLTAHVTQTEFGVWCVQTLRELRGIDTPVVYGALAQALGRSALLLSLAFVGAFILGPVAAGLLHLRLLGSLARGTSSRARRVLALACAALLPPLCLLGSTWGPWAPLVMLVSATLASATTLFGELSDGADWRARQVLLQRSRIDRSRSVLWSLAQTAPTSVPLLAGEVFLWVACIELSSKTDGLFPRTVRALERGDVHALLTLSLLSWTCIALVQTASDALLPSQGERRRSW